MRIFLAGAAGAIGRRLVPLLVGAGHAVTGTTRSPERAAQLKAMGITPTIVDVFESEALRGAVVGSRAEVIIHQLTDLPQHYDPKNFAVALERTARIRVEGTRNLVAAARAAGSRRLIAQSIAFVYAPGQRPHVESDPLNTAAAGADGMTAQSVATHEALVTTIPGIEGIVLRYGYLYGPGTWTPDPFGSGAVHVDAAAHAAFLAVDHGRPGIYNIAEDDGAVSIAKARRELGWEAGFRLPAGRP